MASGASGVSGGGEETFRCAEVFAFECDAPTCCESYQSRFIVMLVAVGIIVGAIVVLIVWFAIQLLRPTRRAESVDVELSPVLQQRQLIQQKSVEETRHLRRMSEMHVR